MQFGFIVVIVGFLPTIYSLICSNNTNPYTIFNGGPDKLHTLCRFSKADQCNEFYIRNSSRIIQAVTKYTERWGDLAFTLVAHSQCTYDGYKGLHQSDINYVKLLIDVVINSSYSGENSDYCKLVDLKYRTCCLNDCTNEYLISYSATVEIYGISNAICQYAREIYPCVLARSLPVVKKLEPSNNDSGGLTSGDRWVLGLVIGIPLFAVCFICAMSAVPHCCKDDTPCCCDLCCSRIHMCMCFFCYYYEDQKKKCIQAEQKLEQITAIRELILRPIRAKRELIRRFHRRKLDIENEIAYRYNSALLYVAWAWCKSTHTTNLSIFKLFPRIAEFAGIKIQDGFNTLDFRRFCTVHPIQELVRVFVVDEDKEVVHRDKIININPEFAKMLNITH